jgi:hypothetical protein
VASKRVAALLDMSAGESTCDLLALDQRVYLGWGAAAMLV